MNSLAEEVLFILAETDVKRKQERSQTQAGEPLTLRLTACEQQQQQQQGLFLRALGSRTRVLRLFGML